MAEILGYKSVVSDVSGKIGKNTYLRHLPGSQPRTITCAIHETTPEDRAKWSQRETVKNFSAANAEALRIYHDPVLLAPWEREYNDRLAYLRSHPRIAMKARPLTSLSNYLKHEVYLLLQGKRTAPTLLLLLLLIPATFAFAGNDVTAETAKAQSSFPSEWSGVTDAAVVQLPNIPNTYTTVTVTLSESASAADNAAAIQTALNNVDATNGTMVVIPAGTYLCNPISIRKDKTILHLSAGTTLKLPPYQATATETAYPTTSSGAYVNFINNLNASGSSATRYDIIIEGEGTSSVIEGQGGPWWDAVEQKTISVSRPCLIRLGKGSRFLFRNFKMQNAPGTNLTLGQSGGASHMTAHDITISNPSSVCSDPSHNTDGMPVWGPYVNIYDCNISTGDDNIVADSNTRFLHAWNIVCGAGHGMSIGSYTSKLNHIVYDSITFNKTETGFRIKTSNDRSGNSFDGTSTNGAVSDIICRNSTMTGVLQPIVLTCVYDVDKEDPSQIASSAVSATTPEFCNMLFQNITSTGTAASTSFKYGCPIYIYGRPESYVHDVTFDNVHVEAQKGMFLAYARDIHFQNGCFISPATTSGKYNASYDGDITGGYVTLDASTYTGASGAASPWSFANDYSIGNGSSKTYAASATSPYVKYSSGVAFTITIPSGKYIKEITFKGFDNYTDKDSYIAEVAGTTYAATDYVFPATQEVKSHKITFTSAVSGTLAFKLSGKQCCLSLLLKATDSPSTGLEETRDPESRNRKPETQNQKLLRNGRILILRGTSLYDLSGRRVE